LNSTYPKLFIKKTSITCWSIFIVLLFFAGFRWDVGIDWPMYMASLRPDHFFFASYEPLIRNLVGILQRHNFIDPGYALFIIAFFILFFFFYSIQDFSLSPVLSTLLFICLGIYFDSLNGVRQFVSIALFVFSWKYLFEKQAVRYFVIIIIAAGFHISALLMLPVYFFIHHKFSRRFFIIVFSISIPLMFLVDAIILRIVIPIILGIPRFSAYGETYYRFLLSNPNPLAYLRIIFPSIIFVFCILLYNRLTKNNIVLLNLSMIYIIVTILFPSTMLMIRIAFYFQAALIFLIPLISKQLTKNGSLLFNISTLIYGILFIYVTQISRPINNIAPFTMDFRLASVRLLFLLLSCLFFSIVFIKILYKLDLKFKIVWKK